MRRGFTLVELLIVIVVIAVLAAIAIPKFRDSSERGREAALRGLLDQYRGAVDRHFALFGCYPEQLSRVARERQELSTANRCFLPDGTRRNYTAAELRHFPFVSKGAHIRQGPMIMNPLTGNEAGGGPFLVPIDPVSGQPLRYRRLAANQWVVTSSATGNDTRGVAYSSY